MSESAASLHHSEPEITAGDDPRAPYGAAAVAGGLVFILYALTLAPTAAFWDASEYIATAHILGIPHPPGNPLFVVLARSWEVLLTPLGLSVPVRVNLFSAFVSALAHGLWFLVVHHVLRYFSDKQGFRLVGAFAAVLVSATAFTVWNQSNVNEKVYTVSLLTIALLSWLAFRWQENLGKGKDDHLLVLIAFILALSVGNHLMAFLAAPAIGIFVLMVRPSVLLNWRLYPAVLLAGLAGLSIHLFLPLRAALSPVISEAAPTCAGVGEALSAIATYGKVGCAALSDALTRQQYAKPPLLPRQAPLAAQYVNYLQYFDWQWSRSLQGTQVLFANMRLPVTMLFTGLGAWGAVEHHRRDRASFYYVATLFATLSIALVFYLNFRYGFSVPDQGLELDAHEVRERDYFFIASFSIWGLWSGVGIAAIWQWTGEKLRGLKRATPVLALAALPLVFNWGWASRASDYSARDWAYNLLMSVEPYGILFTNGDNDTFPLWYLQEVEGIRQDVTVIVTSYFQTAWYTKQLRDLTSPCPTGTSPPPTTETRIICQRPYTSTNTNAVYTHEPSSADGKVVLQLAEALRRPERGILDVDDATIDGIARSYVSLDEARAFQLGEVRAVLEAGTVLYPWQQFGLAVINSTSGDRPVFFASSGNAARELGVRPYLIRQGLAYKLNREGALPEAAPEGIVPVPESSPMLAVTGRWVDLERTGTLLDEVFVHREGLPAWPHWPDRATVGIPHYYAWAYSAMVQSGEGTVDELTLERYRREAEAWARLGGS